LAKATNCAQIKMTAPSGQEAYMTPFVAELLRALPENVDAGEEGADAAHTLATTLSLRPVPVGRLRRVRLLGTLQAKIAAAYLFYWIRGLFMTADENERLLAETHWRTAQRLLVLPRSCRLCNPCISARHRCTGR
jgi:hypothetical protein